MLATSAAVGAVVDETRSEWRRCSQLAAVSAIVAAIAVGGAVWWWRPWASPVEPASVEGTEAPFEMDPPSRVLPFDSPGDTAEEHFSQDITEDIITALGRYRMLSVMAYNVALPYKGQASKPAEIGRALGVRYLLEALSP